MIDSWIRLHVTHSRADAYFVFFRNFYLHFETRNDVRYCLTLRGHIPQTYARRFVYQFLKQNTRNTVLSGISILERKHMLLLFIAYCNSLATRRQWDRSYF